MPPCGLITAWSGFADREEQTDTGSRNRNMQNTEQDWIIVRGGGDIATASIHRLFKAGFRVLVLETDYPSAIRRQVAFSEAVYSGETEVEGVRAVRIASLSELESRKFRGAVPVLVDPEGESIRILKPHIVIDAILAKKNMGTTMDMADYTIALGPGFTAGRDVHAVIETMRGHNLGRIILDGPAVPNTGIPGKIAGFDKERVIHAEHAGNLYGVRKIGDFVEQGETIAVIRSGEQEYPVPASITGLIRGLIRDGYPVTEHFKIADIDPRKEEYNNCFTISDKARCIAGSVLELVCARMLNQK